MGKVVMLVCYSFLLELVKIIVGIVKECNVSASWLSCSRVWRERGKSLLCPYMKTTAMMLSLGPHARESEAMWSTRTVSNSNGFGWEHCMVMWGPIQRCAGRPISPQNRSADA
jgi:hypothetical protein